MKSVILILEPRDYSPEALKVFHSIGLVVFYTPEKETYLFDEVFALITRLAYDINEQFIDRFPNLRYVVSPTTGLNHIDLDACGRRGIEVISLKAEGLFLETVTATAELAFTLMLSLIRNVVPAHQSVAVGRRWDRDSFKGRELKGLTLGIMGLGRLGRQVGTYGKAFGMNVLAHDPHLDSKMFAKCGFTRCDTAELFSTSDVISLHADYRKEHDYLVSGKEFSMMKKGSYFINTSRGELVEEKALVSALESGRLAGAALDVVEREQSINFDGPLFTYASVNTNLIITPHLGGCTLESMEKTELFIAKKFFRVYMERKKLTAEHN